MLNLCIQGPTTREILPLIHIYIYISLSIYIYIEREREREREGERETENIISSLLTACRKDIIFILPLAARKLKLVFPCCLPDLTVWRARRQLTALLQAVTKLPLPIPTSIIIIANSIIIIIIIILVSLYYSSQQQQQQQQQQKQQQQQQQQYQQKRYIPGLEWHYLSNATCLIQASLVLCVFRCVKDHHTLPYSSYYDHCHFFLSSQFNLVQYSIIGHSIVQYIVYSMQYYSCIVYYIISQDTHSIAQYTILSWPKGRWQL